MENEETKTAGFRMPKSMRVEFEKIAKERHVKLTVLFKEACDEYLQRRAHPEILVQQMREILLNDPSILKAAISDEIRLEVQSQLRQILGQK